MVQTAIAASGIILDKYTHSTNESLFTPALLLISLIYRQGRTYPVTHYGWRPENRGSVPEGDKFFFCPRLEGVQGE
jgi:hypothetical protein